jgi:hypothetical protein
MKARERKELISFANFVFNSAKQGTLTFNRYKEIVFPERIYNPGKIKKITDPGIKKIVLIVDSMKSESNLLKMINRFKLILKDRIEIIEIERLNIKNGCVGCYHCGYSGECINNDGFADVYNDKIKKADILIFSGEIKDRFLSSLWKLFFDRSFFNNHVPVFNNKQIGVIISGPLEQVPNIRKMLEAYVEWQGGSLVNIVTDEGDDVEIDNLLENLAAQAVLCSDINYMRSLAFDGVAGARLLRDYVWGDFRFALLLDHKMYKKLGLYNFPQLDIKMRCLNFVLCPLMKISYFRKVFVPRFNKVIVRSHNRVLNKYDAKKEV